MKQMRKRMRNLVKIHKNLIVFVNCLCLLACIEASVVPAAKPIISFCSGGFFTCAAFNDNTVKCFGLSTSWGANVGNVGVHPNQLADDLETIDHGSDLPISKIYCGFYHVCILFSPGYIKCLGHNDDGELGLAVMTTRIGESTGYIGETLPYVSVGNSLNVLELSLGSSYSCIIVTGNRVKCFGKNDKGQLGYGDTTTRGRFLNTMGDNLPRIDLGDGVEVSSIYSGNNGPHNCVILSKPLESAQRIKCWGNNEDFQLGYGSYVNIGDGANEMGDNLPLIDLGIESKVKQLGLGGSHTCALLIDNKLKCWGLGFSGALGSGSSDSISSTGISLPAVLIDSGKVIEQLSTGWLHNCILYNDKLSMKCFGWNTLGTLGVGDTIDRGDTPSTKVPNIPLVDFGTDNLAIKQIYSGAYCNCAVFDDFTVKCFGSNSNGQLGIGTNNTIGDQPYEMGTNLSFALFFSPTTSPTRNPTSAPTSSPTKKPTASPTKNPTLSPTNPTTPPSIKPTTSPTYISPTISPSTATQEARSDATLIGLGVGIPVAILSISAIFLWIRRARASKEDKSQVQEGRAVALSIPSDVMENGHRERFDTAKSAVSVSGTEYVLPPGPIPAKYLAFLSHCKADVGPVASLIFQDSSAILSSRNAEHLDMFIDSEHLTDLRGLPLKVRESKVLVAMLSKSYLTRPWCLIELHFAMEFNIPIVAINVVGAGYQFDQAKEYLKNLSDKSLNKINKGATEELSKLGIKTKLLGEKLLGILPNIIANEYNPNAAKKVRDAQLEIILDHIIAASKQNE